MDARHRSVGRFQHGHAVGPLPAAGAVIGDHFGHCGLTWESITTVEKDEQFTRGELGTDVHGVVNPTIGCAAISRVAGEVFTLQPFAGAVCAGAIDSPKLLLLSGIGDGNRLAQLGIPVLHHLPGVG